VSERLIIAGGAEFLKDTGSGAVETKHLVRAIEHHPTASHSVQGVKQGFAKRHYPPPPDARRITAKEFITVAASSE